jgi:amidase
MTTIEPHVIGDPVEGWVPGGRFTVHGSATGPLAGLTFAAKDLFDIAGHRTGAGNPTWLATHDAPTKNSALVDKLLAAGATLMGKTITDELAYSLHGDNIHYGAPLNANAPDRVTGGSSSGSASVVSAKLVDFALGTDTGGSTRVPASYCALWGLRPTHGLLSAEGLVPLHPSYDTPTFLAHDPHTFLKVAETLLPASDFTPHRLMMAKDACALADDAFGVPLKIVANALQAEYGKPVEDITVTHGSAPQGITLTDWRVIYGTSGAYEGWQAHGEWISRNKPVFAPPIADRWRAASVVTTEAASKARAQAKAIGEQVRGLLGKDGLLILPSAASFAPMRNAHPAAVDAIRLRTMAITCIGGLSGLPQVSIPFRSANSIPLGVSLMGPAGSDLALVTIATDMYERVLRVADQGA